MNDRKFGFGEDDVIKSYPSAISQIKKEFDTIKVKESISNIEVPKTDVKVDTGLVFEQLRQDDNNFDVGGNVNQHSNVRIRTDNSIYGGQSYQSNDDAISNNNEILNSIDYSMGTGLNFPNNTKGASFVIIIAAVLALVAIVAVVTIGIIRIIGI